LADRIRKEKFSISEVKLGKACIKVPKLIIRKKRDVKKVTRDIADNKIPTSVIVNILIKSALEKAKKENGKMEKAAINEDKSYSKEEKPTAHGGYGTVSKTYGMSPFGSYVDYEKFFSYLGKFKSKSAYEDINNPVGFLNKSLDTGSLILAEKETIEKGTRFLKYFLGGIDLNPLAGLNPLSLVPVAGMTSSEWEQFKLRMQLDPVMNLFKSRIS